MLTLLFADGHDYLPIGRSLIQDGALALYWPNSGFSVRFRAHSAIVSFKPFTSGAPLYLKAFLDGKAAKYSVTTGIWTIPNDIAPLWDTAIDTTTSFSCCIV